MTDYGRHQKKQGILVIVLNVILMLSLVLSFLIYDNDYKQTLYNQNIDDISNINQASATIASSFFAGREAKLRDIALYIEANNLSLMESMDFIYRSNSDKNKVFELISPDYSGYCIEKDDSGAYIPLDYKSGYNTISSVVNASIQQSDSQVVGFAPEFTDAYTAMKSFALYNCVHLLDESGTITPYTLMVVSKSADFIDMINIDSGYSLLSTALINQSGSYIIGSNEFKSNNFFKFLAVFNDLTLDQQNEIAALVNKTESGVLSYLDGRSRNSVFVYTPVPNKNWYCVTVVPTQCFHSKGSEFSFAILVVFLMLILLVIDLLYLFSLNRRLKISAENERIASIAKTDFLSRMSHDMRTPMNGIIGMTRLSQDIPNLPDEVQSNLSAIEDSSAYLLQLINDTLDMSKIESRKFTLNPEPVHAQALIQHIISTIKPLANQKQIQLALMPMNADLGYIRADRMRVQQIFMNILSNAVKFTPEHGKISMEVECLKRESNVVHLRISVEDSGCGMSEAFLQHIFEPFSQEHTRIVSGQEGTGLGMAIVKNLVELMGGTVEITSKLGIGTKVTIFIQFEQVEPIPQEAIEQEQLDLVHLDGKRILLAEDHPLNATITKRLLAKKGVATEHAENGALAVQMFSQSQPGYYDAVLMDIRMPEMDGLTASRSIRALPRQDASTVPIIAMTANAYVEDIQAALAAGMNAHLAKPIEPELLYKTLAKYLSR